MGAPRKLTVNGLETLTGIAARIITNRLAEAGVEPTETVRQKNREVRYYSPREALPAIYRELHQEREKAPAKERLELLKIRELELDLAEREGDLGHISALQAVADAYTGELDAQIDGFPHGVAHECAGKTAEEIVGILKTALDSFRAVVAQIRVPIPGLQPADEGSKLNGHRVG